METRDESSRRTRRVKGTKQLTRLPAGLQLIHKFGVWNRASRDRNEFLRSLTWLTLHLNHANYVHGNQDRNRTTAFVACPRVQPEFCMHTPDVSRKSPLQNRDSSFARGTWIISLSPRKTRRFRVLLLRDFTVTRHSSIDLVRFQ